MDLLEEIGDVDAEVVDAWCEYESIYPTDTMLTSQPSSAKRLSSSNLQVNARSDESYDGQYLAWPEELEADCEAGPQNQEAV